MPRPIPIKAAKKRPAFRMVRGEELSAMTGMVMRYREV
jgi:hypothetical protein